MRVSRADGTVEDFGMKISSAALSLNLADIPTMTTEARIAKLNEMADAMAKQISQNLYGSLNESLEKAGQVVDNRGQPFGIETVFAVLEKLDIDFDKQGNPAAGLRFVINPELAPRVREIMELEKTDSTIKTRHEEIMTKKWMEWRDREAARKLVG